MQYVILDMEKCEVGRANETRSAWQLIEAKWPDACACVLGGSWFKRWMKLSQHLQEGEALIIGNGCQVGSVTKGPGVRKHSRYNAQGLYLRAGPTETVRKILDTSSDSITGKAVGHGDVTPHF